MIGVNILRQASAKVAQEIAIRTGQTKLKAQPNILTLFALLTASDSEYTFNFDQNVQQGISPLARGLEFRNSFQAIAMSLGVMSVKTVSAVPYWGAKPTLYWPDPNVFSTAAGAFVLTEAEALEGIFNGDFSLQTNEGLRLDRHDTSIFRTVQQTQGSTQVTGFSGTTSTFTTQNMQIGDEFKSLGGVFNIVGGDDNYIKVRINTKNKGNIVGDGSTRTNYLVVKLLGTEVKGNTTAQLQK